MKIQSDDRSARWYRFSTLAGLAREVADDKQHTVKFRKLTSYDSWVFRCWTHIIAIGSILLVVSLDMILFNPAHWIVYLQPDSTTRAANWIMLVCLAALQLFVLVTAISATRATLKARNPVPVKVPQGLRVAMVTTRAPGEPADMVKATLQAALNVRYEEGKVDVWLLDETADTQLRQMCAELGVKYFSRAGLAEWNTPVGGNAFFAARSKHGNFNSWRAHLAAKHIRYDILAGVDTDHMPVPNYLERMLGYFRDQDVAYVVGPQVYGNYAPGIAGLVVRWSESQASFFQSSVQRAANATGSPMFVGTNYSIRMKVLDQIGGFQPCITEDMATGLAVHASRNPRTGNRWRSVYTPDVLAVGQGPDLWGSYFTQQWRWAAGTFDTWRRVVWKRIFKLSPGAQLQYLLMLTFYPIVALTWLLGMVSSLTYLTTGATAILAPWNEFVALYLMTMVMQFSLYFWNRRFNVSPHEPQGSYGVVGMLLTSLTAPIYLSALIGIAIGKKPHFVVTTKGDGQAADRLQAFHTHLGWAVVLMLGMIYGIGEGHSHPAMMVWVVSQLVICLAAPGLWLWRIATENFRNWLPDKKLLVKGDA